MITNSRSLPDPSRVLCVIMGGGPGLGLFPLTRERAIPAVPLAGNYRLVDVPISSCINSGFHRIYVLTQFNSVSLHRHVAQAYKFDQFGNGFVEILAAEQTPTDSSWHSGSADAVRKNLAHLLNREFDYALILSADQLYRLDFRPLIHRHAETGADVTIATIPVRRAKAPTLGILQVNAEDRLERFVEKPAEGAVLDSLKLDKQNRARLGLEGEEELFLANMGIYVVNRAALEPLLRNPHSDFGKDIIPEAVRTHRVYAYLFSGYWEDVGSMRAFFDANLDLVSDIPRFNFFELNGPIFSQSLYLPGAKVNGASLDHALVAAGCIIKRSTISHSLIGLRSLVGEGSNLHRVIMMGGDFYESQESIDAHESRGIPRIGIGRNVRIENAIIDKNARIGDNVVLTPKGQPAHADREHYFLRDGIIIVPRNSVVPTGTTV